MNDLRKAAEMALEALEWNYGTDLENIENCMVWLDKMNATIPALRQALAQPNDFIYSQNKAFRINPSTGDFGIGSAPAKTLEHKDWCASLTQVLACHPPRPAPCNCKPEYVDAVNMSQERVDETAKNRQEPVAWITDGGKGGLGWRKTTEKDIPLYTAPPKREWQRLTEDDKHFLLANAWNKEQAFDGFMDAIDKFLKEKNT